MTAVENIRACLVACGLVVILLPEQGLAQQSSSASTTNPQPTAAGRDGQHDFDYVRFVISDLTPDSCRFEQAFSADGGKTWEVNWIATDTRIKDG